MRACESAGDEGKGKMRDLPTWRRAIALLDEGIEVVGAEGMWFPWTRESAKWLVGINHKAVGSGMLGMQRAGRSSGGLSCSLASSDGSAAAAR